MHCFDNCFSLFGVLGDNLVLCVTASDANKQIAKFGPQMGYVTFVCLGISIICLSLHIFASFVTSELQNLSGKNLLSLCFALLGGYISFIAGNITIICKDVLTAVFFETGAMLTPTKSQNGTNCGSGGSFQSYLTHS